MCQFRAPCSDLQASLGFSNAWAELAGMLCKCSQGCFCRRMRTQSR